MWFYNVNILILLQHFLTVSIIFNFLASKCIILYSSSCLFILIESWNYEIIVIKSFLIIKWSPIWLKKENLSTYLGTMTRHIENKWLEINTIPNH